MKTRKETGAKGEKLAQDYLKNIGYEIIDVNKHFSRFCEIDIIAKDKDTIVFVEVKTRSSEALGSPLEAITKNKLENIKIGAFSYLQEINFNYKKIRIDAVSVILFPKIKINHLKNIS